MQRYVGDGVVIRARGKEAPHRRRHALAGFEESSARKRPKARVASSSGVLSNSVLRSLQAGNSDVTVSSISRIASLGHAGPDRCGCAR